MRVSAAVMLPPTESPATAMRVGSSWLAAPSFTIDRAVAYPCSSATGYCASGERSYSTNTTAAPVPTASSRTSRVVRVGVAEHPAAAVHVEDHRQRSDGVRRSDDPGRAA